MLNTIITKQKNKKNNKFLLKTLSSILPNAYISNSNDNFE